MGEVNAGSRSDVNLKTIHTDHGVERGSTAASEVDESAKVPAPEKLAAAARGIECGAGKLATYALALRGSELRVARLRWQPR